MDIETVIIKEEPTWEGDGGPPKPEVPRARQAVIPGKRKPKQPARSDAAQFNKIKRRSDNWTMEDKMLLKSLVKEREDSIENKLTDTESNERKAAAWSELQTNFNLLRNGPARIVSQLKAQWGSLKTAARRREGFEQLRRDTQDADSNGVSRSRDLDSDSDSTLTDETRPGPGVGPDEITVVPQTRTIQITPLLRQHPNGRSARSFPADGAHTAHAAHTLEARCRSQLHRAQMANERRRRRNLELKERLLLAKILFFQRKTRELP